MHYTNWTVILRSSHDSPDFTRLMRVLFDMLTDRELHLRAFFHPGSDPVSTSLASDVPQQAATTDVKNLFVQDLERGPRAGLVEALLRINTTVCDGGRLVIELTSPPGELLLLLETAGFLVVRTVSVGDGWLVMAEKSAADMLRGLSRVQAILAHDRKSATYKLALIRALCRIGRTEPHGLIWRDGAVFVPMRSIAVAWVRYYWPLMTGPRFIAQLRGEHPLSPKPIAFRQDLNRLAARYGATGLPLLIFDLDVDPGVIDRELATIAATIRDGPVKHSGTVNSPVFGFARTIPGARDRFGWVMVPEAVWLDLVRFDHWIEDSVVMRWAELTAEMNPDLSPADVLPYLLDAGEDARDTTMIRQSIQSISRIMDRPVECVWTGRAVAHFDVDHVLPYSVWRNNDLWNLLPADAAVNRNKKDRLPSHQLMVEREQAIRDYWRAYGSLWGARFRTQVSRALGSDAETPGWDGLAFAGLVESVERLAATRSLVRWEPK
jgi:hypothetical protein